MGEERITDTSLVPFRVIRTETVLSRLPIHNLGKKGSFEIQIVRRNQDEKVELRWEVSHSAKYGQPRQLAYKLDTLVVNRRIDEIGRPAPRIVRLGSLRDIARELGLGGDTNSIRKALRQNAFTGVTARLVFRSTTGEERRIEADFTRYGVVFAGEQLPDGRQADSVYIILNDPYLDVINNAPFRPLNYDYLKDLVPSAQRFYEIASYKIYAALKNGYEHARLVYSEYCTYAPQQRYFDYDHFKKQMYKVHRPHIASGYLGAVSYNECRDEEGNPDWQMLYVPGPKARAEFASFERPATAAEPAPALPAPRSEAADLVELKRRGISEKQAAALLKSVKPEQPVKEQLEWADRLIAGSHGRIHNPPGFYVYVIKQDLRPPDSGAAEITLPEQAAPTGATPNRQQYDRFCAAEVEKYIVSELPPERLKDLILNKRQEILDQFPSARHWPPSDLANLAHAGVRADLARTLPLPTYEEFSSTVVVSATVE